MIEAASAVSTAVVLGFGAYRVLDGSMSLGLLLVFLTYLGGLYKPVKSLSKLSIVVSKGAAAAERIDAVLQTPIDILDRPGVARRRALRGTVTFDHVSFSYGRESVLHELSFQIAEGQQVALVGPTGAGKSTVASLIPRLFDVDDGCVLVDGLDVRDHALASLRGQIATVLQDSVLLEGTLRENIVCGLTDVTAHQAQRAARLALVDEFSSRLPDGLDTRVGERGASLSGGQRQRVAIARAILRDSPILILDEPTSALDAGSEELVLEALDNLPASRTRIVIAHRLSTIRSSDSILVLDHGRLVESGSHDALMSADGAYARLVRLQRTHLRLATNLG
jgi:ABC-type multidrug transport system fused ATPase/permease subunit